MNSINSPLDAVSDASETIRHWVVIPAAGVGARMQANFPKQYIELGGQSILQRTLNIFLNDSRFSGIFIGLSAEDQYFKDSVVLPDERVETYVGGEERVDTVLAGIERLKHKASGQDWVWVHDAARPCLSLSDIDKLFEALAQINSTSQNATDRESTAVGTLLASRIVDTVKYSHDAKNVDKTLDRSTLWRAFTPQVFSIDDLDTALKRSKEQSLTVTDESSAIELNGGLVQIVEGQEDNLKITRPADLELAEQIILRQEKTGKA